jgi:hypothetical protein
MPLHHPDQPSIPDNVWTTIPAALADVAQPALLDGPAAALVLLDRAGDNLAVVGPFRDHTAADTWQPTPSLDSGPGSAHRAAAPRYSRSGRP